MRRLRRAGSPWRILVHDYVGGDPCYGKSHDVTNDPDAYLGNLSAEVRRLVDANRRATEEAGLSETINLPGTEFDELVIGHWIHLEQMNASQWWINVGHVVLWVTVDRDGRPREVQVYGPGAYDDPYPGCKYHLTWSRNAD
jgi:hypothetical protein